MIKVLLINDLFTITSKGDLHYPYIHDFYFTLFLARQLAPAHITIQDSSTVDYNECWQQEDYFYNYITPDQLTTTSEAYSDYDLIICHQHTGYTGSNVLYYQDIATDPTLLVKTWEPAQLAIFTAHFSHFKGFDKTAQQDYFIREVAAIKLNNLRLRRRPVRNILILDDLVRPFHIGDTYLSLVFLKKTILSFADYGTVNINIIPGAHFTKVDTMTHGSWPAAVSIHHLPYDEIPFQQYDLILCQIDTQVRLYSTYAKDPAVFEDIAIYTYDAMDPIVTVDQYGLDYTRISAPNLSVKHLDQYRHNIHKELYIATSETDEAEQRLAAMGLGREEQFIIFIVESFKSHKVLSVDTCVELLSLILTHTDYKVLLFQSNEESIAPRIVSLLTPAQQARVMLSIREGLRKDMAIMSSRALKAVIGPCTGMLHLASGIIPYLINQDHYHYAPPKVMVYTGRLSDGYTPLPWWRYSEVECMYIALKNGKKCLLPLSECPGNIAQYVGQSLPISDYTSDLLFNYIRKWDEIPV